MKTTIKDLLYFLPIDAEVKAQLLSGYDAFDEDKKLTISKICWNMYHDLYDLRVQQEVQKALAESEMDPSKLSQQMVKDIEKKINDEFQQQLILKQEESNIGQVRQDLENLVTQEIVPSNPPATSSPVPEPISVPEPVSQHQTQQTPPSSPVERPSVPEVVGVNTTMLDDEIPTEKLGYTRPQRPDPFRSSTTSFPNVSNQQEIENLSKKLQDLQSQIKEIANSITQLQSDKNT